MREKLQNAPWDNFHFVWVMPFVLVISVALWRMNATVGYATFGALTCLECLSQGIHQYVHHQRSYFGRPGVVGVFAGATALFIACIITNT